MMARGLAGVSGAVLGWRPDDFWAATPDDLAAVFGAVIGEVETPADAALIGRLQEIFPDG